MKVLIVEDHPLVVDGWLQHLRAWVPAGQFHHVSHWDAAHQALMRAHHSQTPYHWVILDVQLLEPQAGPKRPALADRIRACSPSVVWVFTAWQTPAVLATCEALGVLCLSKGLEMRSLRQRVLGLVQAQGWDQLVPVAQDTSAFHWAQQLTHRQLEVLAELANGLRNSDIAEALQVSEETVRTHLSAIFRAMGVRSRSQATRLYWDWRHGQEPSHAPPAPLP